MGKPRYIEADYTQTLRFDLEDLDIDWNDVKDYWVKWAILYIELKNGEVIEEHNYYECDMDWKCANNEQAYDEDFYKVELKGERRCLKY